MNTPVKIIAVVGIIAVVIGLAAFSFTGVNTSTPAPIDNTLTASSTPATSTTSTITRGPTSQEPEIPLNPNVKLDTAPSASSSSGAKSSSTITVQQGPVSSEPLIPPKDGVDPAPQSFTIHASDESADLTNISVPSGTKVTITFFVNQTGTYYGGLDFRSSVLNTGTIATGQSKSISFTATSSFSFTPYWPASNVAKPYKININVQ